MIRRPRRPRRRGATRRTRSRLMTRPRRAVRRAMPRRARLTPLRRLALPRRLALLRRLTLARRTARPRLTLPRLAPPRLARPAERARRPPPLKSPRRWTFTTRLLSVCTGLMAMVPAGAAVAAPDPRVARDMMAANTATITVLMVCLRCRPLRTGCGRLRTQPIRDALSENMIWLNAGHSEDFRRVRAKSTNRWPGARSRPRL